MSAEPLIAFLLIRELRKVTKNNMVLSRWHSIFTAALYILVILFIIDQVHKSPIPLVWVWHLALLGLVWITFNLPEFASVKPVMISVIPLISLTILGDIINDIDAAFYTKFKSYFNILYAVAITWMITMLVRSKKQVKALETERKKTQQEEERSRFIAAQKAELEILVKERTAQLTAQRNELQNALEELKSTQNQLIHSEKMASLGELTAGIAHEIQNPLNFVNNFSDVNVELIDEMKNELKAGNTREAVLLAENIKENQEKITHHGKRADAIVKGMLQHSRKNSGQAEPTDINALADEYLRLSYHGLRAKDKSFNATMHTDFDDGAALINIIPQDIGRVLLNLYNNAFYAVAEKKKLITSKQGETEEAYEPTVSVSTKKINGNIEIKVKDNGTGIPQNVIDKIYQPFFTTKPTGQGTGLGLSLSYDIVRAHGGEMRVTTQQNECAEFIILLPLA